MLGRAGVQLGGEVDLVEPDVRVAEERRVGDRRARTATIRATSLRGQAELVARAPCVVERARHLGVDRQVHGAVAAARCSRPSPAHGSWLSERGSECRVGPAVARRAETAATRTGARPAGARARRGARAPSWPSSAAIACVISARRVDARVVRVDVLRVVPEPVHRRLEPVGEVPVVGVAQRRGADGQCLANLPARCGEDTGRAGAERDPRDAERASHEKRSPVSPPLTNSPIAVQSSTRASLRSSRRSVSSSPGSSGANTSSAICIATVRARASVPPALRGQVHGVLSPVLGVAAALGQADRLELVDHGDHRAGVDQRAGDQLLLGAAGVRVDQREHAEVLRAQPERLQRLCEPCCHALPVPGQQEPRRAGKGLWGAVVEAHVSVTNITLTAEIISAINRWPYQRPVTRRSLEITDEFRRRTRS